jgi:hypothetical protein
MNKIVRVFPRKTSMMPTDPYAFVGDPPLWKPEAHMVHVSVSFTWDIEEGRRLREAWAQHYPVVKLGGPAFNNGGFIPERTEIKEGDERQWARWIRIRDRFVPGMYIRHGVTFTSRGCDNDCPWCLVPQAEGKLRTIQIMPGHIVQDNNLLQCPASHRRAVFQMLSSQRKAASFPGGLDARLVTDEVANELRGLRIHQVFLAADTEGMLRPLSKAIKKLSFLPRQKLRCYVLIAYGGETMAQAETRLRKVWELGAMPFAQLYQPPDRYIDYDHEWKILARIWSRPAAMKALMAGVESGPQDTIFEVEDGYLEFDNRDILR